MRSKFELVLDNPIFTVSHFLVFFSCTAFVTISGTAKEHIQLALFMRIELDLHRSCVDNNGLLIVHIVIEIAFGACALITVARTAHEFIILIVIDNVFSLKLHLVFMISIKLLIRSLLNLMVIDDLNQV